MTKIELTPSELRTLIKIVNSVLNDATIYGTELNDLFSVYGKLCKKSLHTDFDYFECSWCGEQILDGGHGKDKCHCKTCEDGRDAECVVEELEENDNEWYGCSCHGPHDPKVIEWKKVNGR